MKEKLLRYINMREYFWANGNSPFNGYISKSLRAQMIKQFYKLNAEHAIRQYRLIKKQIQNL